ncbi:hypothetical protein MY4038_004286 [Beauveria bassiana]
MQSKAAISLTFALSAFSAAAVTIDRRIVGGEDAKDGEFPSVVSITGSKGICGGTLLDSTTVLTAAHCLAGTVSVRAGSLRHDSGGVETKVANRTSHPEYLLSEYDNTKPYANHDIGIIKLASPIKKSDKIDYASLPADGSDAMVGSMGTVAGWGVQEADWTFAGDVAEENLAKVTLPVHAREVCDKLEPSVKGRDTVLCIGGNGKSACRYSSGGGFFDDTTSQVVGVASWVIVDKERLMCHNAPMIYTRVDSYVSFIKQHLEGADAAANPDPAPAPAQNTTTPDQGPRAK